MLVVNGLFFKNGGILYICVLRFMFIYGEGSLIFYYFMYEGLNNNGILIYNCKFFRVNLVYVGNIVWVYIMVLRVLRDFKKVLSI